MHKKFFRKQKHGKIHVVRDYMDDPLFTHVEVKTGKASSGLWVWISYCCSGFICKAAGGCLNDMAQFFLAQLLAALRGCNRPACFWYKGETKRQTWGDTGEWYMEVITFLDYSKKNLGVCNPLRLLILWDIMLFSYYYHLILIIGYNILCHSFIWFFTAWDFLRLLLLFIPRFSRGSVWSLTRKIVLCKMPTIYFFLFLPMILLHFPCLHFVLLHWLHCVWQK